jgi:hypothetical protein
MEPIGLVHCCFAMVGEVKRLIEMDQTWGLQSLMAPCWGQILEAIAFVFVEWWADHLPARRLGAFGTMILLLGLILQSIQYWVVLLNVVVQ